ncbi:MAG: hypothetical protein HC786_19380 [Richelia sp. CSU_2_1]|nr:hypothetical protein [Richelia sp. CSU_2_1]
MKIGTLSESSRQLLRFPQEIEKPQYLKLQNVRAMPAFTEAECSLLFKQAAQLAENFQSECNLKGETDAMAAATWHSCCAPENNAGGSQKTQNFAFAAWGSQIAEWLGELQFKELTVGELNGAGIEINSCIKNAEIRIGAAQTDELENFQIDSDTGAIELDRIKNSRVDNNAGAIELDKLKNSRVDSNTGAIEFNKMKNHQTYNNCSTIEIEALKHSQIHHLKNAELAAGATAISSSANSPALGKRTLEIMKDGKYVAAGTISEKSAQLPIGTTARADLIPALAKTATIHLPGCDNPVKVGKVAECDFGGQSSLSDREYTIAIRALNKPKYLLSTSGKVIGELDGDSIESLKNATACTTIFPSQPHSRLTERVTALTQLLKAKRATFCARENKISSGISKIFAFKER